MPEDPAPWKQEDEQKLADKFAPEANPKLATPGDAAKPVAGIRKAQLEAAIASHERAIADTKAASAADGVNRENAIQELSAQLIRLKAQLK